MEEEGGNPILSEPHFYWGNCFVCKRKSNPGNPMKRCTRCRAIYYCSKEHQLVHWKRHKRLCNYLASATGEVDQFSFFSGLPSSSSTEWNTFRMNAVITCEVLLGRPLQMCEKEMFLFPRACRLCHASEDKMFDCESCYCLTYCSEQHREEDRERHTEELCRQLTLTMVADIYESLVAVGVPAIPSQVDTADLGTAPDITHFLPQPLSGHSREISKPQLDFAFLTCQLSGPLTLLDSILRYSGSLAKQPLLTVHVVGAALYEMIGIIKWEYLIHRLPSVKKMVFCFIGPSLEEEEEHPPKVANCEDCENRGRVVEYKTVCTRYDQFLESVGGSEEPLSDAPDLVLVQNCGFSEYKDSEEEEGWTTGWKNLHKLLPERENSLLVFTSYTLGEAERDLERFLKYSDTAEVLAAKQENPMRSHRPVRDWETDGDKDVFYYNQFVSVVRKQPQPTPNS